MAEPLPLSPQRLQKLMAGAGVCSRRQAETLLLQGRVRVNGQVARLGDRADLRCDRVELDGRPLPSKPTTITVLLHKPRGVLSSCHDPSGGPTVLDLLPDSLARGTGLHPVGRLDRDSRGALLLTTDGDLTLRLTHPRYRHRKTYRVWITGQPAAACLELWRRGVPLDGQESQPVGVGVIDQRPESTLLELEMAEGRNRQIRRTAEVLGYRVLDLCRIAVGPIALGALPEGRWRRVDPQEWGELDLLR